MTVRIRPEVETDLEEAFAYYSTAQAGYGRVLIDEFRRALDRVIENPTAWTPLAGGHRRCQLNRFPYAIIYHYDEQQQELTVTCLFMMQRKPGSWRPR